MEYPSLLGLVVCLSVCLSVCLLICLSDYVLSVCLSVSLKTYYRPKDRHILICIQRQTNILFDDHLYRLIRLQFPCPHTHTPTLHAHSHTSLTPHPPPHRARLIIAPTHVRDAPVVQSDGGTGKGGFKWRCPQGRENPFSSSALSHSALAI